MKRWGKALFVVLLGLLMFLFIQDTTLAKGQIKISVEEGIDGKVKEGRGFPLNVTVENSGSDFKGDLLFDYAPSYQTGGARALSIDVPANSERTYTFSITGFNDEIRHNSNLETIHLFEGSWKDGKEVKFKGDKRLTPNFIYSNNTTIGILSENPDRLKGIKGTSMGGNRVQALTLTKETFPEEGVGLQMLDYIVIDQFNVTELSQNQQKALKRWVENGGVLMVGAAPRLEESLGSVATMLPLTIQEVETELSDTSSFNVKKSIKASFNTLPIFKGKVKSDAEIIVKQGDVPLVTKSDRGLGEVWQTSFSLGDPALNDWENYDEWFANMLSKTEPYYLLGQQNGDQSFLERIYYDVADSNELFPSTNFKVSTLVIILILYLIVIVPLLYFLLRKLDKREQAWWIIPALSILVSTGIFVTGAKDRISKPHLNQMSVLKVEDDKSAHGISAFTALSNSGGNYDFVSDKNQLELTPARMRNNPGGGNQYKFAIEELSKDERKIIFRDVEYWSTRTVLGTSEREDLGSFIPELVLKDKTITGKIKNEFPYDFTDLYIWSGSRIYRVGEVKAGETLTIDKKLSTEYLSSPIGNPNMAAPFPNQQSIKQQKKERLENFASQMISADNENNSPVIFGYTEAEIFNMKIKNKESKSENFSLLYQHFPSLGQYKGAFTLRSEQLDLDVKPIKGQIIEHYSHNGADEMGLEDGTYEMTIQLPKQMDVSKVALHSLNMTLHTGGILQYSLIEPNTDEKLLLEESSANTIEVKENLNNYMNDNGEIVFEFEKRSQGDPFVRLPAIVLKGEVQP
ncbi:hypothetical protein [Rossellomorea sp. NPDC077527]|uniref:DUF7408 domain-containing protein n=1 Tax=Rossellomorea sp. NPDC077527 TaxID=3364510 RepID=UPI0037CA25E1